MMQIQERGSRTELQHLLQLLDDAKYVSWNRRKDDGSDVLSDIFWAHPDSIKLLNLFPIVLVMDCTYKTNKYRQPLLETAGITSTNMTFAVGFAYMESEKTNNYHWALEDGYELDMSNAMEAIWTRFRSLDIVGKRALKSKVFELAYPASSSLCPPPEKIKTRGGVKNKYKGKAPKGYDVYRDPSYFEHVEREYGDSQGD
ncbi:unnamed protein product [Trifolium pratense]|uniref:Uncharacterized protein n=1 Tax=Trifolium pratense TaxID=57577 RepID=A0ACB0K208_TRIPR|nr:unnamed protein product [Trifolium pratense]